MTEKDIQLNLADQHKESIRYKVKNLQFDFQQIKSNINNLPIEFRLNEDELNIDPEYEEMLKQNNRNEMDRLEKQLQWHHEKARVSLSKVKDRYLTPVEVEKFKLKSFLLPKKL